MTAGALPRSRARHVATRAHDRRGPVVRPLAIFTMAVILVFFAVIYSRISLDRTAFELQRLDQEIAAEQERHWDLRVDYARLQAPDLITQRAAALGLVYPEVRHTLEISGTADTVGGPEDRWVDLRALLVEQP
ncbi:MAG: hypothetical protein U9R51_06675 [Actinomycetota bacterium]|nr:hypothetical protein [Actinomycetota bacterium]